MIELNYQQNVNPPQRHMYFQLCDMHVCKKKKELYLCPAIHYGMLILKSSD